MISDPVKEMEKDIDMNVEKVEEHKDEGVADNELKERVVYVAYKRPERTFICEICSRVFRSISNLRVHMIVHNGTKNISCHVCGKMFAHSGRLRKHMHIHSTERRYSCEDCGKSFIYSHQLNSHRRVHTKEKPYGCKLCSKFFAQSSHLKGHIRTHLGKLIARPENEREQLSNTYLLKLYGFNKNAVEKKPSEEEEVNNEAVDNDGVKITEMRIRYPCTICNKTFTQSHYLKVHERVHTGEKKYACPDCGKCFAYAHGMRNHRRIHSGERPYNCNDCDARFAQIGHLIVHTKRAHTGDKKNRCEKCGRCFKNDQLLEEHKRKHIKKLDTKENLIETNIKIEDFVESNIDNEIEIKNEPYYDEYDMRSESNDIIDNQNDCLENNFSIHDTYLSTEFKAQNAEIVMENIKDDDFDAEDFIQLSKLRDIEKEKLKTNEQDFVTTTKENEGMNKRKSEVVSRVKLKNKKKKRMSGLKKLVNQNECTDDRNDTSNEEEFQSDLKTFNGYFEDNKLINEIKMEVNDEILFLDVALPSEVTEPKEELQVDDVKSNNSGKLRQKFNKARKKIPRPKGDDKHSQKGKYTCRICDKTFGYKHVLKTHTNIHTGIRPFVCEICGRSFIYTHNLMEHRRGHFGDRPYECKICSKTFIRIGHLQKHTLIHTGIKSHACEYCGKLFSNIYGLEIHSRIHTGIRPYECKVCNKTFAYASSYNGHKLRHMRQSLEKNISSEKNTAIDPDGNQDEIRNDSDFVCLVCNKSFSVPGSLKTHLKIHSGIKDHVCDICNKAFTYAHGLEAHKRVHSGVRPYECKICNRRYTHPTALYSHKKVHFGEQLHKCDLCEKTFPNNRNFKRHMKEHTGIVYHQCNLCSYKTIRACDLRKHLIVHERNPNKTAPRMRKLKIEEAMFT